MKTVKVQNFKPNTEREIQIEWKDSDVGVGMEQFMIIEHYPNAFYFLNESAIYGPPN